MIQKATFAAGCFWHVEDTFRHAEGVQDAISGYMGGTTENPTYEDVGSGKTGHAESVEVTYDDEKISYEKLLEMFWEMHDPTTPNKQGLDVGSQYRSVIFYYTDVQKVAAEKSRDALVAAGKYKNPIVTSIEPAGMFYKAEEYHQRYFEKNGGGVCGI